MKPIDLTNRKFGRLTALYRNYPANEWMCRCECGVEKSIPAAYLRHGNTKSCGCYRIERGRTHGSQINLRHGEGGNGKETPEYRTWAAMKSRCMNPHHTAFIHYGARGIRVCERWMIFENFIADMGRRPAGLHGKVPRFSIDRVDNNGDYCPENCRWSTPEEQNNNTRHNRHPRFFALPSDAAPARVVSQRIRKGWPEAIARSTPMLRKRRQAHNP